MKGFTFLSSSRRPYSLQKTSGLPAAVTTALSVVAPAVTVICTILVYFMVAAEIRTQRMAMGMRMGELMVVVTT